MKDVNCESNWDKTHQEAGVQCRHLADRKSRGKKGERGRRTDRQTDKQKDLETNTDTHSQSEAGRYLETESKQRSS